MSEINFLLKQPEHKTLAKNIPIALEMTQGLGLVRTFKLNPNVVFDPKRFDSHPRFLSDAADELKYLAKENPETGDTDTELKNIVRSRKSSIKLGYYKKQQDVRVDPKSTIQMYFDDRTVYNWIYEDLRNIPPGDPLRTKIENASQAIKDVAKLLEVFIEEKLPHAIEENNIHDLREIAKTRAALKLLFIGLEVGMIDEVENT